MDIQQLDLNIIKAIISNRKYGMEFCSDANEKLLHPDLWRFTRLVIDYLKIYKEIPTKKALLDKTNNNENFAAYVEKTYSKLESFKYDDKNFPPDLDKLKKRYQENAVVRLKALLEKNEELPKTVSNIQSILNTIKEVDTQKVYNQNTLKDGIDNFIERFKYRRENPDLVKGTNTGFSSLDFITGGLKTPEYVLCCGSSGAGKSTLLMSLSVNMFLGTNTIDSDKFFGEGNSVIYYSLEIPYEECFDKLISYLSKIPLRTIQSTNLTDEQQKTLSKTLKFIKKYPHQFVIVDIPKGATSSQMESIYTDFQQRDLGSKVKVVCIDYLGLVDSDEKGIDQDWLKQASISEELYKFCRVNDLILLTGVQLNETAPNKNENGMGVFRLARSKSIINPATLCLMLESRPEEQNYSTINVHIVKNRRGPKGMFSVRKAFEICSFINDIGLSDENVVEQDISNQIEKFESSDDE